MAYYDMKSIFIRSRKYAEKDGDFPYWAMNYVDKMFNKAVRLYERSKDREIPKEERDFCRKRAINELHYAHDFIWAYLKSKGKGLTLTVNSETSKVCSTG